MTASGATIRRNRLLISLIVVIAAGIGSRMIHSGVVLVDKYLGDALYAVMIYLIIALAWNTASPLRRAAVVMFIITAIETFQLTAIPLGMTRSGSTVIRIIGRLIGTTFSWLDLAAYFVGIAAVLLVEYRSTHYERTYR